MYEYLKLVLDSALVCKNLYEKKKQDFTVVLKRKSKWHHLWSKLPISDLVFYNIKLPPCSGSLGSTLQLTGALKRGTVWTSSSTGIGIMKGRSWTLVFY